MYALPYHGLQYKPWSAEYEAISLAGFADGRRIDDGRHLLDVLREHAVEEPCVAVLQRDKVRVLIQVVLVTTEVVEYALYLLLLVSNGRRQQTVNAKDLTFFQRERRTLRPIHDTNTQPCNKYSTYANHSELI